MAPDFHTTCPIYETVVPMKVHTVHHDASFRPSLHIFLSIPLKGTKITKEHVNKLAPSIYYVTQKQLLAHVT